MRYKVSARVWDAALEYNFGNCNSEHELSDTDIIRRIIMFGRAEITGDPNDENSIRGLEFHNDYD